MKTSFLPETLSHKHEQKNSLFIQLSCWIDQVSQGVPQKEKYQKIVSSNSNKNLEFSDSTLIYFICKILSYPIVEYLLLNLPQFV